MKWTRKTTMPELLTVTYAQTGKSSAPDALGMREMQARAYAKRHAQYLLLKAPPASGKSRALMFLALDKIHHQGLNKAIIAVPEMSIAGSFCDTNLSQSGFFAGWHVRSEYNLCTAGNAGKVDALLHFLEDDSAHYLLCTHATLRFAWERLDSVRQLDRALIAIDEFHHTSAEDGNRLGAMLDDIMDNSTAHVIAMTGSYFRGDQVPILTPEAEARFTQVTYTYYEQLNGYRYLKSLGLGYHFYQGRYFDALQEVLDTSKKTIIHIPNVNSRESSGLKLDEVDRILDIIGTVEGRDAQTGILTVRARDGRRLKVADLVSDDAGRINVLNYLREISIGGKRDDMDIIIALGMAKEGFDWPWCEHVLTIGYRSSLTEVVQIIGRATRDCAGKSHAQFTNLIAQPDAADEDVKTSVNNLLKAITLSLLMREVLAPNITFRPRSTMKDGDVAQPGEIIVEDSDQPVSPRVREILESGGVEQILTTLITKPDVIGPALVNQDQAKVVTEVEMPKIIAQTFPDLQPEEVALINDLAKTRLAVQASGGLVSQDALPPGLEVVDGGDGAGANDAGAPSRGVQEFLRIGDRLLNVDYLNVDLIDRINPFQGAYEILSKAIDAPMLKTIQDHVTAHHSNMTEEEAVLLWENIKNFKKQHGVAPSLQSDDPYEKRLAEALAFIRDQKARKLQETAAGNAQ